MVFVLSPEDGRQRLIELARELSTSVMSRQLKMEDINVNLLTDKLAGMQHSTCKSVLNIFSLPHLYV